MRVIPPREMLEYLDSIGVGPSMGVSPKKSSPPVVAKTPSGGDSGKSNSGCLVFFLIPGLAAAFGALLKALTIILVAVGLISTISQSNAQDASGNPAITGQSHPSGSDAEQEELLSIPIFDDAMVADELPTFDEQPEEDVVPRIHDVAPGIVSETTGSTKAEIRPVSEQTEEKSVEEALMLDIDEEFWQEFGMSPNAHSTDIPLSGSRPLSAPIELWPGQNEQHARARRRSLDTPISRRDADSSQHSESPMSTLLVVGFTGLIFFAGFYFYTERTLRIEIAKSYLRDSVIVRKSHSPEPSVQMTVPRNWRLGFYSTKGNVRSENEDFVRAFELNDYQVLLIADGCGGVPFGRDASRIAVETCSMAIFRQLLNDGSSIGLAIERGFEAASDALVSRGNELGLTKLESGLRTTLIVAIGTASQFDWGYIGDGALRVISSSGEQFECMEAHRANPMITNVLGASLGPTIHGQACFGSRKREPGDVLLAGTDGVFDRVDDRFSRDLMRMAIFSKGDLMVAARESVEQLANITDVNTRAFVCDDNLTLGLMMDGRHPDLRPEFWQVSNLSNSSVGAVYA